MKPVKALLNHICAFCQEQNLIPSGSTIIVGLSGGPDSVFLLHYLAGVRQEKNLTLIAAHLDHGWRTEAAQEALFCQTLADTYQIPLIIKNLKDTPVAFKSNGSKEELGRKARRAFFEQLAKEHNGHAIALAHHADDQMETFFMRLIRGASLTGLAGIKPKDGLYIRPLLNISKREILNYLEENMIPYVIDASNQSDEYLRNRIRNSVIPALHTADERFEKNFATTHSKLVEAEEFLQKLSNETLKAISSDAWLDIEKLLALHPALHNRVLINWLILHKVPFNPSNGLLDEIIRYLEQSGSRNHTFYGAWQIVKQGKQAQIKIL